MKEKAPFRVVEMGAGPGRLIKRWWPFLFNMAGYGWYGLLIL